MNTIINKKVADEKIFKSLDQSDQKAFPIDTQKTNSPRTSNPIQNYNTESTDLNHRTIKCATSDINCLTSKITHQSISVRDLLNNEISGRFKFEQCYKLVLNINTAVLRDFKNLMDFIDNPNNQSVLDRIQTLEFGNINQRDQRFVQRFMKQLDTKVTQLRNLTSFSFGNIRKDVTLTLPQNLDTLTSFSCGNIEENATLALPEKLDNLLSFSCGNIRENGTLTLPQNLKNLTSFSCGHIWGNAITLPQNLDTLIFFTCGDIGGNATLTLPES